MAAKPLVVWDKNPLPVGNRVNRKNRSTSPSFGMMMDLDQENKEQRGDC